MSEVSTTQWRKIVERPCVGWNELEKESKAVQKTIEAMTAVESPTTAKMLATGWQSFSSKKLVSWG
jgi:hypothetical protein